MAAKKIEVTAICDKQHFQHQLQSNVACNSYNVFERIFHCIDIPAVECSNVSAMGVETATRQNIKKKNVQTTVPKHRQDLIKWNGWGYNDSKFIFNPQKGVLQFTGSRYPIGELDLPYFTKYVVDKFNLDLKSYDKLRRVPKPLPKVDDYPQPNINSEFLQFVKDEKMSYSIEGIDRLFRCHGQALNDIMYIRELKWENCKLPDLVLWPKSHEQVNIIVKKAVELNIVIIPFGGGTNVSWAVSCPINETRMIVSLDTSQMNRMLWLDKVNLVACFESGIVGQDLEKELKCMGYTSGHEPDSYEFSSLGGWVATRASGMKKNTYGNIEDLLVHVKMVTPSGTLDRRSQVPRLSCGPDFNHVVLGSEGTLGVITEVAIKIRPLPKTKKYGSIVFPDFECGFSAMRSVAENRCQPASIRLMDNEQFKFGQSLKPVPGYLGLVMDGLKKLYITKIQGFDVDTMCVATLLFEGDPDDVALQEKKIYEIAKGKGGVPAGETNGERGYTLTFVIAYIRDIALDFGIVAESFETSVPWDRTLALCRNVKHRISCECRAHNITHYLISCRVTQTYDVGCCVYFYFGFNFASVADPLATYHEIEDCAREEILAAGGSISHHHGVGKLRSKFYGRQVSRLGVQLYKHTKSVLDPGNIFASGNLVDLQHHEPPLTLSKL